MENEEPIKDIPKKLQQTVLNSARKYRAPTPEIHLTTPNLDEEDIDELERNERFYSQMVSYNRKAVMYYGVLEELGVNKETMRAFINLQDQEKQYLVEVNFMDQALAGGRITPARLSRLSGLFKSSRPWKYLILDDDFEDDITDTPENQEIPYSQILAEQVRVESENLDLLRLYLGEKRQERKKAKKEAKKAHEAVQKETSKKKLPTEAEIIAQPEEFTPAELSFTEPPEPGGIILEDWQLFYTTHPFSDEEHYLIPFQSATRVGLTDQLSDITLKEGEHFGIPSISVINALDFHLHKDRIQKALSLRNKYWLPDWSKIKRGRTRIMCKINEGNHRCVFFAGQRKDVYRQR